MAKKPGWFPKKGEVWSPATDPELQKRKAPATLRKEEFFNRLQSAYGEAVRDRMIAIPDSVHDAMKELSLRRGEPLY